MNLKNLLIQSGEKLNIIITDEMAEKFLLYKDLLISWNEKINLTAIIEPTEIITKHFIDSLTISNFLNKESEIKVVDIGTGAGFPGIPLNIVNENVNLVLVDATKKRINFLNEVIKELDLKNIICIHDRGENLGHDISHREKYDYSVSRAVANLATLSEFCLPLVKYNGQFIALKGPGAFDEVNEAKFAITTLGGEFEKIETIEVFNSERTHNIVFVNKIKTTPTKYPRHMSKISKNPLRN